MAATGTINEVITRADSFTALSSPSKSTIHRMQRSRLEWKAEIRSLQTITLYRGTPIPERTGITLNDFLVAEVLHTPDGIVISSGEVDEDGYGLTFQEAYIDFLTSVHDRYSSLQHRKKRLSTQELSVLKNLRRLF